jgi:hypothetical protein
MKEKGTAGIPISGLLPPFLCPVWEILAKPKENPTH